MTDDDMPERERYEPDETKSVEELMTDLEQVYARLKAKVHSGGQELTKEEWKDLDERRANLAAGLNGFDKW